MDQKRTFIHAKINDRCRIYYNSRDWNKIHCDVQLLENNQPRQLLDFKHMP